ncbi:hypothetical protein CDL12_20484 [Handroanthus impetiginosus]|uniref:Ribosomal protein L34Ae n=1 Tax=Handroanthus impetiginosus TaxID=429701 RepID=A0A2G9GPM8_9LAMI|nr:hypothetical protein CDL12_20484 [Handroanthus impetiginosus]
MFRCPKETFARLFYNVSSSFLLLFIFFHFTSIFLAKLFIFFGGNPFYQRTQDGYEFNAFSDEEMEEEEEEQKENYDPESMEERRHLVDDIVHGGDHDTIRRNSYEPLDEESLRENLHNSDQSSSYSTPAIESDDEEEEILARDTYSSYDSEPNEKDPTSRFSSNLKKTSLEPSNNIQEAFPDKTENISFRKEENFLVFQPPISEGKKLVQEKDEGEIFGDTFTIGSTSKDSSEWRSSINCRDSGTEDPFSSSSRRSCPNWESYTVFQKYDEEMSFLDRISVQKLHETESLRSIQVCPRSISERIVHKLRTKSKRSSEFRHNPYHELESAYVAQICMTWEALNWNYKYFQRLRASRREYDPGCPAYVAQQFQQFQVLLQRYVENEPYEHGRRPEIYARMRSLAPKLLQVPEYRDSDDDKREEGVISSRIPSSSFLHIMEESIRTFMSFLKQDKKNHYEMLADLFRRNKRGSADATLLLLLKKVNKKKKAKLNELRRSGKCLRKRKLRAEEELEILMAQIDLKVASRVLRMAALNGEQLHWCENKMSKVRVSDGKLQRDSSPLFFPAH